MYPGLQPFNVHEGKSHVLQRSIFFNSLFQGLLFFFFFFLPFAFVFTSGISHIHLMLPVLFATSKVFLWPAVNMEHCTKCDDYDQTIPVKDVAADRFF